MVVSGGYSTPGFGSLDKKVSERQRETKKNYTATAAINLDKFFPEKWGVKLPMYVSYSADIKDPQPFEGSPSGQVAAKLRRNLTGDVIKPARVEHVKRPELAVRIPPVGCHGLKLLNFCRIN